MARTADIDFDGLKDDFGIGIRFHGPFATPLRVELAKSREGLSFIFASSAAFKVTVMPASHVSSRARRVGFLLLSTGAIGLFATGASTQSPHFYPDDPIARAPESQDASKAAPYDQSQMYELTYNLFVNSKPRPAACARRTSTRSTRSRTRAGSRTASAPTR